MLQPCRRRCACHRAGTAAPSGPAGRGQREQGGVAADLTDDVMAEAQRGTDQRAAHVPGVEQQADRTRSPTARSSPLAMASLPALPRLRHRPVTSGTERGRSRQGTTADSVTKHWHSRNAGRSWPHGRNVPRRRAHRPNSAAPACHRSRRSSAPLRSLVGRSGTAPISGRAAGTGRVRASSGRPASRAAASAPGTPA